ncbi:MAG: hypothetical protein SO152_04890 [Ruminococcus sp.]|nr:hypothetical protein [Oscillospiraceae bacterium]MDY4813171.1 hypothetical protein [Ruminococcus sp.]
MDENMEKVFVDNDSQENLLLPLSPDEIDKLYEETFGTNET